MDLPEKAHYKVKEVAAYFDIEEKLLYRWIDEGVVYAINVAGKRTKRIPKAEVERMKVSAIEA